MSLNIGNIKILSCGYCTQLERLSCRQGAWKRTRFFARCFLVPITDGFLLFDGGYAADTRQIMSRGAAWLYKQMLPVTVSKPQTAAAQLARRGIAARDIKYIFISHFHADHIGGLRDFPHARFICSRGGYQFLKKLSAFRQVCKGFVRGFLPDDFESRVLFAEQNVSYEKNGFTLYALPNLPDMYAVSLPGHAAGQLGLWLPKENLLLAADAAWRHANLKPGGEPASLALKFCEDKTRYLDTLKKLAVWPGRIIFTHEDE